MRPRSQVMMPMQQRTLTSVATYLAVTVCTSAAPGCLKVAPAWSALAQRYAGAETPGVLQVGSVDCDVNMSLCAAYSVTGVPAMVAFGPGSQYGEVYRGGINLKSLKEYALVLADECDARSLEQCTESGRALIQGYLDMSLRQLAVKVGDLQRMFDSTIEARDKAAGMAQATEATDEERASAASKASRADNMVMTLQKKQGTKLRRMKAVLEARGGTHKSHKAVESSARGARKQKRRKWGITSRDAGDDRKDEI